MNHKLLKLLEKNARYTLEELSTLLGEDRASVAREMDEMETSCEFACISRNKYK